MGPRGCLLVCAVVLGRAGAAECVGWRQTRGCTAEGAREPGGDAGCDVVIPAGRSGFCECSGGNRVGHGCGHTELTCRLECGDAGPSNSGGRCVAWRQTAACDPQGVREPHLDKDCSVMVQSAWSGYCECARGGVAARSGCDHPPFRCEDACRTGTASREDSATQCVGWRQTGHCRDDGPREPAEDLGCGDVVPRAASGYCECVGGVRAGQTGCNHPQFTCEVACARRLRNGPAAAWRDPALPACTLLQNAGSIGGGACGRDLRVKNLARRVLTVGQVDSAGRDGPGKPLPPGVTMLAKTCVGHVWRARDASGRVLGEHRVSGSEARPLWEVAECRGRRGAVESGRHGVHVTSSFMGGAFSLEMGTLSRSDAGRGRSITFVIKATLAHLWSPRSETIKWTREAPCPVCEGRGAPAHHVAPCPVCGGSGLEHEHATVRGRSRWANGTAAEGGEEGPGTVTFAQRADARCSLCDGYGERPDPKHVCRACKGMRMVRRARSAQVDLPAGAPSDWTQVFEGEGHAVPGGTAGDVVVKLEVEPHPNFTRAAPDSPDLETTLEISLKEALLGFQRNVSHPLGHNITVESSEITSPDDTLIVPGEGLPVQRGEGPAERAFGDLQVTLDVSFPQSLHGMQRQSLLDLDM